MIAMTASRIVAATRGELVSGSRNQFVTAAAIDSRCVVPGSVFFAFEGERSDGHAFVRDAIGRGARVVVVTRVDEALTSAVEGSDVAVVLVEDATAALQTLAARHRAHLTCPVVGVTGSSGKTTTKDLLRSVLARRFDVVATEGNRNNELGVPLTLLDTDAATGAVVLEMAMRGAGQIAALCEIAKPTAGLVTNVGQTHIELLGSEQAIAMAKAELVRAIPPTGRVFLNGDDEWARVMAGISQAPVTYYGMSGTAEVRARDIVTAEDGLPAFTLDTPEGSAQVTLRIPGRHNAYNAAAAASVGLYLGLTLDDVVEGLAEARVSAMRMEVFESATGVTVINDAYNANPSAMRVALTTLTDMTAEGRHVAVLGDMAELGSLSELAHFRLGEYVSTLPVDVLVTVGELGARIGEGALRSGMAASAVKVCATPNEAAEASRELLRAGDVVLVKASRVVGLERVVEDIMEPHAQA